MLFQSVLLDWLASAHAARHSLASSDRRRAFGGNDLDLPAFRNVAVHESEMQACW
jgi:hypothetical protein